MDLSTIPNDVIMARGKYSTIRSAHEDSKKALQVLCGKLSSVSSRTLRQMQPDNDVEPESVADLLAEGRKALDDIEATCKVIAALAQQRAELRPLAWGRS
jgi:hypothetical protein